MIQNSHTGTQAKYNFSAATVLEPYPSVKNTSMNWRPFSVQDVTAWTQDKQMDAEGSIYMLLSLLGHAALSFSRSTSRRSWTKHGWNAQVLPWGVAWSCCCGPSPCPCSPWEALQGLLLLAPWPLCWEGKRCWIILEALQLLLGQGEICKPGTHLSSQPSLFSLKEEVPAG